MIFSHAVASIFTFKHEAITNKMILMIFSFNEASMGSVYVLLKASDNDSRSGRKISRISRKTLLKRMRLWSWTTKKRNKEKSHKIEN